MATKRKHSKPGLALPEFLITLAILSILATVVVVSYVNFIDKARIASDDAITDQLNLLITAHKIETGKLPTGDEISQILQKSGVTFDQIAPSSTNRHLYYNSALGCFVWIDDDEINNANKENYTEITGNMLTPTEPEDEENNPNESEGDKEQSGGDNKDDADQNKTDQNESDGKEPGDNTENATDNKSENTVTFNIKKNHTYELNTQKFNVNEKGISVQTDDEVIKVKFCYNDEYISRNYPKFDLNEFITATDSSGNSLEIVYSIEEKNVFTYFEQSITKSYILDGSEVIFYKAGIYHLQCTANGKTDHIDIHVINLNYNKAEVKFNKCQISISSSDNKEYKVNVEYYSQINIYDYQLDEYNVGQNNRSVSDDKNLMTKLTIVIEQNGNTIEIPMENSQGTYSFTSDDFKIEKCTVTLKYLGANGEIVYSSDSKDVQIK